MSSSVKLPFLERRHGAEMVERDTLGDFDLSFTITRLASVESWCCKGVKETRLNQQLVEGNQSGDILKFEDLLGIVGM